MLELKDDRRRDGTDILSLFLSDNDEIKPFLRLNEAGFDPLEAGIDDADTLLPAIHRKMGEAQKAIVNGTNQNARWNATMSLYALKALEKKVAPPDPLLGEGGGPPKQDADGLVQHDDRLRKVNPATPSRATIKVDQKLEPDSDDDVKEAGIEAAFPFRR